VLPLSTVQRQNLARRVAVVNIAEEWSTQRLKICVRELEALPDFARELVEFLVADAAAC
jgi:hypothetical protein